MAFMPFGRFRGLPVEDLPDTYLQWLCTLDLRPPLLYAVQGEAARRGIIPVAPLAGASLRRLAEALIGAGLRSLARTLHPDVPGGSHEGMSAANHVADHLRQYARGAWR
jgi:hypothetical protein